MTPLSKEVQEQIEFAALAVYPVNLLYGNPDIDLNDYCRSSWIAGATWYAERAAENEVYLKNCMNEYRDQAKENLDCLKACQNHSAGIITELKSQLAEKDARITELEAENDRLYKHYCENGFG